MSLDPYLAARADFDKDHMPTLDQVNEVMDGLTMLDAHLQARAAAPHRRSECS